MPKRREEVLGLLAFGRVYDSQVATERNINVSVGHSERKKESCRTKESVGALGIPFQVLPELVD